jgi:hypothetical protein
MLSSRFVHIAADSYHDLFSIRAAALRFAKAIALSGVSWRSGATGFAALPSLLQAGIFRCRQLLQTNDHQIDFRLPDLLKRQVEKPDATTKYICILPA